MELQELIESNYKRYFDQELNEEKLTNVKVQSIKKGKYLYLLTANQKRMYRVTYQNDSFDDLEAKDGKYVDLILDKKAVRPKPLTREEREANMFHITPETKIEIQ